MPKYMSMLEKAIVTFVEEGVAYFVIAGSPTFNRTALAGALGAGLSAVYNLFRTPATPPVTPPLPPPGK
jgi:hypothetical protein